MSFDGIYNFSARFCFVFFLGLMFLSAANLFLFGPMIGGGPAGTGSPFFGLMQVAFVALLLLWLISGFLCEFYFFYKKIKREPVQHYRFVSLTFTLIVATPIILILTGLFIRA